MMTSKTLRIAPSTSRPSRIGLARLTKMAFDGQDLAQLWNELVTDVQKNPGNAPALLDLSFIAQLTGDPQTGASLQSRALLHETIYRSPCTAPSPRLRLLAFAAPVDIGGNTPVEFLIEGSDVQLETLYVAPGLALPDPLPAHDVAIVTIPDSVETRPMLDMISALLPGWPRPVLNDPQRIKGLDRDALFETLQGVAGLEIPSTARLSRIELADIALSDVILRDILEDGAFPLIVRPAGSHAGKGLEKLETPADIAPYLAAQNETEFFVSRFVDYRSDDGLYRKYRVVLIDGRAYACHMAICAEWKVWYLNADMATNAERRAEEERFMTEFDLEFARRHETALAELSAKIGLDYFAIDCAETKDGKLLVFEADNAAIVHAMDPVDTFPYKVPQMRKVFAAFQAMLYKHSGTEKADAA